jgi:AraC-like DNA-binding protein
MHARPLISSSVTIGLLKAINDAGADPNKILKELDLDRAAFSRTEGFIPCSTFARLLESVAAATGDQAFGLHFGARFNPKNIGALAYAVFNSPTVSAAFETAGRYLHLHNEAAQVVYSEEGDDLSCLSFSLKNLDLDQPRQFVEYGMAVALNTLRVMVGSQWSPREVRFAHPAPKTTTDHLRLFRAPVAFACATNAFVLERDFCNQPIPAADPNLFKVLNRYLETVLSHVPKEDQGLASVRRKIAEAIKDGGPNLAQVAKAMAWSPRTLQRQLNNCGIDFRTLVDDTRRRFALDYLKDANNTLTQIAFLLGYSEVSAFNRSFKRWTGKTPLDYRRSLEK